ncbi:MAG TPA: PQQ-dependent sugar dehydrogenase [Balneolaceae bacterium]
MNLLKNILVIFLLSVFGGCNGQSPSPDQQIDFTEGNGGLTLPEGFRAVVVAENLGPARHITIAENGDIYVSLQRQKNGGGIVALRDTNGDGKADQREYFGDHADTGIQLWNGFLFASSPTTIFRYEMSEDSLVPSTEPRVLVEGFIDQGQHNQKAFAINDEGELFVNVGAPSNSCQEQDRRQGSPGMEPCPLLERYAGIWKFSATELGQTQTEEARYATGLRNIVAIDWNSSTDALYVVQHGRDQLYQSWPEYYTQKEGAVLPAEAMYKVNEGDDFGWPYSYYDQRKNAIMLAPEYGGDGETTIAESEYAGQFEAPIIAFPGHWAPNGLIFYTGNQFPEKYRNGAFVAFHGSWNRAPFPQQGYKVVFVPFENGEPAGSYTEFATGFAGGSEPQPATANHRPSGLAIGPDGSLYISDDTGGTLWRVMYVGE